MDDLLYEQLWSSLSEKSRTVETEMDALQRKRTGSYFTDLKLTDVMMCELLDHLNQSNPSKKICEYRFLEPCVGSGNFVFSYINAVRDFNIDRRCNAYA